MASASAGAAHGTGNVQHVLVYAGEGVGSGPLRQTLHALRSLLSHRYDVKPVEAHALAEQPWPETTALLVLPGGRDLPFVQRLSGKACARIRKFVEGGGAYLGLCAGAYFGCRHIEFERGTPLEVTGPRELALFVGTAKGSAFGGFQYDSEVGARAATVRLDATALVDLNSATATAAVYTNGGCWFEPDVPNAPLELVRPLAWYTGPPVDGALAIVECRVGKGVAILSGVHPEYSPALLDPRNPVHARLASELQPSEPVRAALFRSLLRRLGLKTLDVPREVPSPTHAVLMVGGRLPTDPLRVLALSSQDVASLFADNRGAAQLDMGEDAAPIQLPPAPRRPIEGIQLAAAAGGPLAIYAAEQLPRDASAATFDSALYFSQLRKRHGGTLVHVQDGATALRPADLVWGGALLYAEVITSTQTLLDRNMGLTERLPSGFVCLATQQVSGRGRGGNTWVSSPGCLQFSVVLRHRNSATLVFIQYVMALAVVHAVRSIGPDYEGVELAIKWPNDIYSVTPSDIPGEPGLRRKIGGVLVNSSFGNNGFVLVVGCGVNVSNSEPTDCINDVIARHNQRLGTTLALLRKEELLAAVMSTFEDLYNTMESSLSFAPLRPLYYRYWLHNGEHVTLDGFGGITAVVEGLSDQGFLRTRSITNTADVFEHQPDGNSFDIMRHMIVKKVQP